MSCESVLDSFIQNHLLLSAVIEGVGSHGHQPLANLLMDILSQLMDRRNTKNITTLARRRSTSPSRSTGVLPTVDGEGQAVTSTSSGNTTTNTASTTDLSLPQEATSSSALILAVDRICCNFLALLLSSEHRRATIAQRDVHTFMRGNTVVPLLFDALGKRCIQPTFLPALDRVLLLLDDDNEEGASLRTSIAYMSGLSSFRPPSPVPKDGSVQPASTVTMDNAVRDVRDFMNALWDTIETSIPRWPLCVRWALYTIYGSTNGMVPRDKTTTAAATPSQDATPRSATPPAAPPTEMTMPGTEPSDPQPHDLATSPPQTSKLEQPPPPTVTETPPPTNHNHHRVSMLATIVVLRMISPCLMSSPSRRPSTAGDNDDDDVDPFDPQVQALRRRVTFITKLLQKAAYYTPSPGDVSTAVPSEAASASIAAQEIVLHLHERMVRTFWPTLCDGKAIFHSLRDDCERVKLSLANVVATTEQASTTVGGADDASPSEPVSTLLGATTNSPLFATTDSLASTQCDLTKTTSVSDMSASSRDTDQEVLLLFHFMDRHVTSILGFMNAAVPQSAAIHMYMLHSVTWYAHRRRLERGTPPSSPPPPRSQQPHHEDPVSTSTPSVPTTRPKATSIASLASTSLLALRNKLTRSRAASSPQTQEGGGQQAAAPSSSSTSWFGHRHDEADASKGTMFLELVQHAARCRVQPETMNFAHLFGVVLGNVESVVSVKAKEAAESSAMQNPTFHHDEFGGGGRLGSPPSPDTVGSATIVLYADQLTEASQSFNILRDRNQSVIAKLLPNTVRYCQKHSASSLHDSNLDAAAHLCYLLDVVARSSSSCNALQILFFTPQAPLKCGCGKDWMRAVFQHLIPNHIAAMVAQMIYIAPPYTQSPGAAGGTAGAQIRQAFPATRAAAVAGGSPSPARTVTTQQLLSHDVSVAVASGTGGSAPTSPTSAASSSANAMWPATIEPFKVRGTKSHCIAVALERLALGSTTIPDVVAHMLLPSQFLLQRIRSGAASVSRHVRVPLTLRDFATLRMEVTPPSAAGATDGTQTPPRGRGASVVTNKASSWLGGGAATGGGGSGQSASLIPSGRSIGSCDDVPPSGTTAGGGHDQDESPPLSRSSSISSPPRTSSVPVWGRPVANTSSMQCSGWDALGTYNSDVWSLDIQRNVLVVLWTVHDQWSRPRRSKTVVASSTTGLPVGGTSTVPAHGTAVGIPSGELQPFRDKARKWFVGFHPDLVDNLMSRSGGHTGLLHGGGDWTTPSRSTFVSGVRHHKKAGSNLSVTSNNSSYLPASFAAPPSPVDKSTLLHCTWFGFLNDCTPQEMAEFERQYYAAVCAHHTQPSPTHVLREQEGAAGDVGDIGSVALSREQSLQQTETWVMVDESGGTDEPSRPRHTASSAPPYASLCTVSFAHVTFRGMWRMLLYSVSRSCSVVLFHPRCDGLSMYDAWCAAVDNVLGVPAPRTTSSSAVVTPTTVAATATAVADGDHPQHPQPTEGVPGDKRSESHHDTDDKVAHSIVATTAEWGSCEWELLLCLIECVALLRQLESYDSDTSSGSGEGKAVAEGEEHLSRGVQRIIVAYCPSSSWSSQSNAHHGAEDPDAPMARQPTKRTYREVLRIVSRALVSAGESSINRFAADCRTARLLASLPPSQLDAQYPLYAAAWVSGRAWMSGIPIAAGASLLP